MPHECRDVLACALLLATDDLEARAIVAEHHDPVTGPLSAAEYRTDAQRLRLILDAIAPGSRPPDPERAAVVWIDGTWTVANGRPIRLQRQDDLEGLLESSLDLIEYQLVDSYDALTAIHHLIANVLVPTPKVAHRVALDQRSDQAADLPLISVSGARIGEGSQEASGSLDRAR